MSNSADEGSWSEDSEDLYENAPCGYLSTSPTGLIVRANRTLLTWLGFSSTELIGQRSFHELLTIGGRMYYEMHCAPLLQMQGAVREVALEMLCNDKRKLPVLINATSTHSAGAGIVRITVFDATDRRKYEQELVQARVRAEEADQAKAAFIAMVSHEIRTPLGSIMAAQHLLEKTELSERQKQLVRMLRSSSSSVLELINAILDVGKLEAGRVELLSKPVDLRALVTDTVESLRARAEEKGLLLGAEVGPTLPVSVLSDPIKIRQILTNLVINAIKFTDTGWVRVALTCDSIDSQAVAIRFTVSDSGIGIDSQHLLSIFEPYSQLHKERSSPYEGSGLGLAISKRLVELFGGELGVESEPGQGASFSFALHLKYDPQSEFNH